ncbi:MAG: right-handed parallel beta-helix repeat-containing protein [Heyndrickxia sp.]
MKKWYISLIAILLIIAIAFMQKNQSFEKTYHGVNAKHKNTSKKENAMYELELSRWGIYNDGTNAISTTKGFNDALKWASENGYTTVIVPGGTYLIAKGTKESDPNARINMVSNMTLQLDEETILQKETNGFEIYSLIYIGPGIENVTIKGGTLQGDRDTHDYSQKGPNTGGTHEWGNGIDTAGAFNINIKGVKIKKFTGDGIGIGGTTIYGQYITEKDVEPGGIDDNGVPIVQNGKIRSNNYAVENFSNPVYNNPHYRNLMMWLPNGVKGTYDLFYYRKDGAFLKVEKDQRFNSTWGFSHIPNDADYFRVVFNADTTKGVKVNRMTVAITENMLIKNCDIGFNRRQGITVGASESIKIINNNIHDISGTAPQSGIDIEPGFYPALDTLIKDNQFVNNKIHMVFAYGGKSKVENNYFGPNVSNGLGFSINPAYQDAVVQNNTFDHSGFTTGNKTKFLNNTLLESTANFNGGTDVIIDVVDGIDSIITIKQTVKYGIKGSNIRLKSSETSTKKGGINLYGEPINLRNIKLDGNNSIYGNGNENNIYEYVSFTNTPDSSIAAGSYKYCSATNAKFELNVPGKTIYNHCKFFNTTIYTYNMKTEAIIKNSAFNFDKDITNNVILAMQTKNIEVINNIFNDVTKTSTNHSVIQIGRDAWANKPTNVLSATIIGNTITANVKRKGIDTLNGGIDAPPYVVKNNKLTNTTLNLKPTDINENNKISIP